MVVDTSALVAILLEEPERDAFVEQIAEAEDPMVSATTLAEASIVMQSRAGDGGVTDVDELLASAGIRCVAVDDMQAHLALEAFYRFGKGRSPAGLNFGDCFSYALAGEVDVLDFRETAESLTGMLTAALDRRCFGHEKV